MGWTGAYNYPKKPNGKPDAKQYLDNNFQWETETAVFSVLKSSMVGNVYYAALQKAPKDGTEPEVFGIVTLTSYDYRDECFMYKEMSEDEGPVESKCPAGILKLLTPTDSEWANQWRERCYANIAEKKEEKNNAYSLKNLPLGSRISYTMKYYTNAYNAGDTVEIYKRLHYGKEIWTDGMYAFKKDILPKEYDVFSVGNQKLEEPVHVSISRQQEQEK